MADEMNGKLEFIYQFDTRNPKIVMTLSPDAPLTKVFEAFEMFLRGAGYRFDGVIDIVNYDIVPQDDNADLN